MNNNKKILAVLILTIVGTIVLLLVNPERFSSESSKQHLWTTKTHSEKVYDIVVYGDSRVYRGFSTKDFLGDSELSCFNFGYSSGSFSERMLEFCESKLSLNPKRRLIFGITAHSFTEDAFKDEHFLQEVNRSSFDILLKKYKSGVLKRFDPISPKDIFGFSDNVETFHTDGWVSTSNTIMDTTSGLESYIKVFTDNPIAAKAITNFMKFVQVQVGKGVEVFAYRPPTMRSMDQLEDRLSGFDFNDFIDQFEKAGGKWVQVNREAYKTYDGSHLTIESTKNLSKLLGEKILD